MKNKYNLDFDLKHKRLKKFRISLLFDYFICCSSFLNKEKGLKFLKDTTDPKKKIYEKKIKNYGYNWGKKVIEKSEIIMDTHPVEEGDLFLGYVNLNKKDHFFLLHGDTDALWSQMPPLGFFKYVTTFKHKLHSLNCNSGKLVFFSDEFIDYDSQFKNKKLLYEFKVTKGKYSLYSMNIESESFKKDFPYSNTVGALLVKD